ncbi:MAG: hypothetical protein AAF226_02725, partial [Verrucomicrobiota bacterium]
VAVSAHEVDGLFPLDRLQEELVPAVEEGLRQGAELGEYDPVAAMEGAGGEAERQLKDVLALTSKIDSVRKVALPEVESIRQNLMDAGYETGWITEAYEECGDKVEALSRQAQSGSIQEKMDTFDTELLAVLGRVRGVRVIADSLKQQLPNKIEKKRALISERKSKLAGLLQLAPERLLVEEGLNPDERIQDAEHALALIRHALNRGNLESARSEVQSIDDLLSDIDGILSVSLQVAETGEATADGISERISDASEQLPEAEAIVEILRRDYHPSVQLYDDGSGQQCNVSQNVEKGNHHLVESRESLQAAENSRLTGQLLLSGGQFERAANEVGFAVHSAALVKGHYSELLEVEAENRSAFEKNEIVYQTLVDRLSDLRTIQKTKDGSGKVGEILEECRASLQLETSKDPFGLQRALAGLKESVTELDEKIEIDWNWYATASNELQGAMDALDEGERFVSISQRDGIADSSALTRAIDDHQQLKIAAREWQQELAKAHSDWEQIYRGAVKINSEAAHCRSRIERELQYAQRAVKELEQAADAISDLKNWRGAFRVSVDRDAGDSEFSSARSKLSFGDYEEAYRIARAAADTAQSALSRAKSRERSARAAEAAERRRREAARRRRQSSSSSISRTRSRSGGSSRSSSSSSRGSSGSGFSRSGW